MPQDNTILGLTDYEMKAYEALIQLGKSTAAKISKLSNVPYGKIYEVLSSLEKKGLVILVGAEIKHFVPADFKKFSEFVEQRKNKLDSLSERIKELGKMYNFTSSENVIEISEGSSGFFKIFDKMPTPKKTEYNVRYFLSGKVQNPSWIGDTKNLIERGIDIKTLADKKRCSKEILSEWGKVLPSIKHLKN